MPWITHISRSTKDGTLRCNTQSLEGVTRELPVHQIPTGLPRQGASRAAELDSESHSLDDISLYLALMGWESLPAHGQCLHRFATSSGEFWVPSQLLVQSLFCTIPPLSKWLFTPHTPAEFCQPIYGSLTSDINASRVLQRTSIWASGTAHQRLGWLVHSKSAMRGWSSIYRNALDGRLDCALPEGSFGCWLRGVTFNKVFCVTSLKLATISCEDIYTRDHPRTQVFQWCPYAEQLKGRAEDVEKKARAHLSQGIELSDTDFNKIVEIMCSPDMQTGRVARIKNTASLRSHLNILKIKEQRQCGWVELPGDKEDIRNALWRLTKFKSMGKWEAVRNVLVRDIMR